MSVDGTSLLFEGFLQKRKDTLVSFNHVCSLLIKSFYLVPFVLSVETEVGHVLVQASEHDPVLLQ